MRDSDRDEEMFMAFVRTVCAVIGTVCVIILIYRGC